MLCVCVSCSYISLTHILTYIHIYTQAYSHSCTLIQVLANTWWSNHRQREHSIIQHLFTGQYKSIMKCGCNNYSSSRFEPFTYLTLPVPEDKEIVLSVYIVYIGVTYPILCSIRVSSDSDVGGLIRTVLDLKVPNSLTTTTSNNKSGNGSSSNSSSSNGVEYEYIIAVTLDCAVVNFYPYNKKISTFRDSDVLVLFQLPAPIENKAGVISGNLSYSSQADAKSSRPSYGYVILYIV